MAYGQDTLNFALGSSAILATMGAIGGATLQTLNSSVSVAAHATMLGSFPLIGFTAYSILRAQKVNELVCAIFSFMGSYFTAYALTNSLGLKVTLWAPVFGICSSALMITPIAALALGVLYLK